VRAHLGSVVSNNILLLHAIFGCDSSILYYTMSGVYGLAKKLSMSKIKSDSQFQDQAKVFISQGTNKITSSLWVKQP